MPTYFHFWYHNPVHPDNDIKFNGQLKSMQCDFVKADGHQCRRRCVIGLPCCFSHLPVRYHVIVKPSLIPGAGKGLFAYDKTKGPNDIVFKGERHTTYTRTPGDKICPYYGEIINQHQLQERYGENTAPYGIEISDNRYEDAALERGVGSLLNHKLRASSNCTFSINRNNRIDIRATKNIRNGQELHVSYGNQYQMNEPGVEYKTDHRKTMPTAAAH
jgi:hypothetical protein